MDEEIKDYMHMDRNLKNDIAKTICYLVGHKPIEVPIFKNRKFIACSRCKKTISVRDR